MHELTDATLPSIIAHARAGSLDRAWAMFEAAGYGASDEPAALAIKGRLLKDRAQRGSGAEAARLYGEAASAYARSAAAGGATYPLINAATLSLLAGDPARSAELARQVLERIEASPDEPETPYYRAATRAEALLLLGRGGEAQAALGEAVALAPRAWEDHASTLRQFALILAARGEGDAWLDSLRPPRSLHFGGHMSFRAEGRPSPLTGEIAALLAEERIGFGYGALAAGADILIAETLLERGAELHLVLPGGVEAFAALSVDPFGSAWRERFDAALARADTVRAVAPVGVRPDPAMIGLADEAAMGAALGNARRLASEAIQLLVLADAGDDSSSHARTLWLDGGATRRQRILIAAREGIGAPAAPAGTRHALAALAIRLVQRGDAGAPVEAAHLAAIKQVLDRGPAPVAAATFTGEAVVTAYDAVAAAAATASELVGAMAGAISVGGHYGVGDLVRDPFSGASRLTGRMLAIGGAAAASALPGTACVSEDFAAALEVADPHRFKTEFVGELADPDASDPIGLHALRRGS